MLSFLFENDLPRSLLDRSIEQSLAAISRLAAVTWTESPYQIHILSQIKSVLRMTGKMWREWMRKWRLRSRIEWRMT